MAESFPLSRWAEICCAPFWLRGFGLLALGCGGSAGESGTSAGDQRAPILVPEERANLFPSGYEPPSYPSADPNTPLVEADARSARCDEGFTACGGILAGTWSVEGSCTEAPLERGVLQRWSQSALGLDSEACADAVQTLDSRWGGDLRFQDGLAIDLRRRSDTAEVALTRECLSQTFGLRIRAGQLEAVCATLTSDSRSCALLGDGCQCTVQSERPAAAPSVYGVLGETVSIAAEGGHHLFEYCVIEDRLEWREPDTGQLLLLRRTSPAQ